MVGTFWSLVPSIVAIALALITKEVYSSLFIGVVLGAIFYAVSMGTGLDGFITHLLYDSVGTGDDAQSYGIISCLSDAWNVGILMFLVILGTMVALMNKAGGSAAFGMWAIRRVRTKVSAQIAVILLGIIIFIDDYFNCLTVGSVMRPVTDRYGITKEKLAYFIDSTAAPVCIIAPISSWAAAVSGFVSGDENGITLFCSAIPFNFYAFFTLIFTFLVIFLGIDFGAMKKFETVPGEVGCRPDEAHGKVGNTKLEVAEHGISADGEKMHEGSVADLIVPILLLIVLCIGGMLYSGGFFDAASVNHCDFVNAFAESDASRGLVIGSLVTLLISIAWFFFRRVLTFDDAMSCLVKGFEAMVPAILILTLAWSLKSMTDSLGAAQYVAGIVSGSANELQMLLPGIIFIIAALLAFATGTSWGTFGILIPICIAVFPVGVPLRIISISACMAGAVCGDHISPISDTTIMASAGAQCKHVNHVSSQLPYAMTVASVAFISFIVAGFTQPLGIVASCVISWAVGVAALMSIAFYMKKSMLRDKDQSNN